MGKPILCLDWDGVIHSYTSGWKGADVIPDPPVPGAMAALVRALDAGWDVQVFSSRSNQLDGIEAMRDSIARWLLTAGYPTSRTDDEPLMVFGADWKFLGSISFPTEKPPAVLTIDDRAICFDGNWDAVDFKALLGFKPWNKGGNQEARQAVGDMALATLAQVRAVIPEALNYDTNGDVVEAVRSTFSEYRKVCANGLLMRPVVEAALAWLKAEVEVSKAYGSDNWNHAGNTAMDAKFVLIDAITTYRAATEK